MTKKTANLDQVINHMGSVLALANALGIERQAIYQWKGKVPPRRAYEIERVTKGKFKADDLLR